VADHLIILDGTTFMYSEPCGDVEAEEAEGFFYEDVRHLSRWLLRIDGRPLEPLTSRAVDYYSARIVGTRRGDGDGSPLSVRRDRFVTEGMHEDVVVENLQAEPRTVRVELVFGSDFADVLEAQQRRDGGGRAWVETRARSAVLWEEREGYRRGTALTFNRAGRLQKDRVRFDVRLRPRGTWSLCIDVSPIVERPAYAAAPSLRQLPPPRAEDAALARPVARSGAGPRHRSDGARGGVPSEPGRSRLPARATGRPARQVGDARRWTAVVHGRLRAGQPDRGLRDAPFPRGAGASDAPGARRASGRGMGQLPRRRAGQDPHELRRGTLAALGKIPHTPYYGLTTRRCCG
jgi:hypothetical protein